MHVLTSPNYPSYFKAIKRPPAQLYYRGTDPVRLLKRKRVAIVGSRRVSSYGKQVAHSLASELSAQGVVIVSGLAIGVDATAHRATLATGGLTMAVLPSPVDAVAPAVHESLAADIVHGGGTLISAYASGSENYRGNFVERNEIVAAMSDVVIIVEAETQSGSIRTANFAVDLGVPILAVPGSITSATSRGTNELLKTHAHPLCDIADVWHALGMQPEGQQRLPVGSDNNEQQIIDLIASGIQEGNALLEASGLTIRTFNQTLTMLEISAKVRALGNNCWGLN
jgi:DNA processing protein